jgi:hypothetical protein
MEDTNELIEQLKVRIKQLEIKRNTYKQLRSILLANLDVDNASFYLHAFDKELEGNEIEIKSFEEQLSLIRKNEKVIKEEQFYNQLCDKCPDKATYIVVDDKDMITEVFASLCPLHAPQSSQGGPAFTELTFIKMLSDFDNPKKSPLGEFPQNACYKCKQIIEDPEHFYFLDITNQPISPNIGFEPCVPIQEFQMIWCKKECA